MREVIDKIQTCTRCEMCKYINHKVIGKGSQTPKYLFISDAPKFIEDKTGVPFSGDGGRIFNKWIEFLDIEDEYAAISLTKCKTPGDREPTAQEIANCKEYLDEQIRILNPEIIICVSKVVAQQFVAGIDKILKHSGKFHNEKYYLLPHPNYFLKNPTSNWRNYFMPLKAKINEANEKKIDRLVIDTPEKFSVFIDEINHDKFAFDTETTSLDIQNLKLVGMSFYDGGDKSYYLPFGHQMTKQQLNWEECKPQLIKLFNESKLTIGHNLTYDMQVIKGLGIYPEFVGWFDTMVAAHLLDENSSAGLKNLSKNILGKIMTEFSQVASVNDISYSEISQTAKYACDDAIRTYQLYEVFEKKLTQYDLDKLFYDIEMPFLRCIIEMEWNGVLIDLEKIRGYEVQTRQVIQETEQKIYDLLPNSESNMQMSLFGDAPKAVGVDLNSPKQMAKLLYNDLKLPIKERSKRTGEPSTGVEALQGLKDEHPVIPLILKHRKFKKLSDSFLKSLPKHAKSDGRIHARFNDTGTVTGRLSSSNPNLQQLPRSDKKVEVDIRGCFIAGPGKKMVVYDYSQEELRLAAFLSNDDDMIKAYNEGLDLHLLTANKIFDLGLTEQELVDGTVEYEKAVKLHKEKRTQAKSVVFGILYGRSEYSLSDALNIPIHEAKDMITNYFKSFPKVKQAIDNAHNSIKKNGFVRNYYGRYRRFEKGHKGVYEPSSFRQSYNFVIQGTAADILRVAMSNILKFLHENNDEARLIFTVHDELCVEVPDERVDFYMTEVKRIMEESLIMNPPLIASGECGDSYSEAK